MASRLAVTGGFKSQTRLTDLAEELINKCPLFFLEETLRPQGLMVPEKSVQFTDSKSKNFSIQSMNGGQFTWQQQAEKHFTTSVTAREGYRVRKVKDAGAPRGVRGAFKYLIH